MNDTDVTVTAVVSVIEGFNVELECAASDVNSECHCSNVCKTLSRTTTTRFSLSTPEIPQKHGEHRSSAQRLVATSSVMGGRFRCRSPTLHKQRGTLPIETFSGCECAAPCPVCIPTM
ncbi:hypothetical protein MRX96_024008 [Rhipicephalus microplus]